MIKPINSIGKVSHIRNIQNNNSNKRIPSLNYGQNGGVSFTANPGISRFAQVDTILYRGARPNLEQLFALRDMGIAKIIDFSVEPGKIAGFKESEAAKNLGMEYFQIPFVSWETPTEADIKKFFEITEDARKNNKKVFIHCLEGRDRTGLFTELYKIKYGMSNAQNSINTLIKGRYNFSDNPCAVSFIKDFEKSVCG